MIYVTDMMKKDNIWYILCIFTFLFHDEKTKRKFSQLF